MAVAEPYIAPATPPARRGRPAILRAHGRLDVAAASLLVLVTLIALLAPVLAPHNPIQPVGLPMQSPGSGGFLLGTDSIGRDILSRVLFGWRSSWFAALAAVTALAKSASLAWLQSSCAYSSYASSGWPRRISEDPTG